MKLQKIFHNTERIYLNVVPMKRTEEFNKKKVSENKLFGHPFKHIMKYSLPENSIKHNQYYHHCIRSYIEGFIG